MRLKKNESLSWKTVSRYLLATSFFVLGLASLIASNGGGGGGATTQPGTLQFSSATYGVAENGSGLEITVTRTNGSDGTVTVEYTTSDLSATAGNDYTAAMGTLTFVNGEVSHRFTVQILDDATFEGDETFNVILGDVSGGATLATPDSAVVTISDDEIPMLPGTLQLTSATYSVPENSGNSVITVSRLNGSTGTVTVDYSTSDGSATAGNDYMTVSGTLIFPSGINNRSFNVPIVDDEVFEGDENIIITLSNVTGGATIGSPGSAVLTIEEDESGVIVSISWEENRESSVNAPGGGYRVYYSTIPAFDVATANVVDVPYSAGPAAPTSVDIPLPSGTYYFKVVAYSALNISGSEPSQEQSIVIP